jgi:protein-S-isoprenylcysteine O-methyltransferase Ste14
MNTLIPPPIVTASFCALMWWLDQQTQTMRIHTLANRPLAIALLAIALGLMAAAVFEFWKHRTTVNPMNPGLTSTLVSTGVFRFSRNPIYAGDALLIVAWAIWLNSITALISLPLFIAYISKFQIQPEEVMLASKFKEQFTNYCKSVRRWV